MTHLIEPHIMFVLSLCIPSLLFTELKLFCFNRAQRLMELKDGLNILKNELLRSLEPCVEKPNHW